MTQFNKRREKFFEKIKGGVAIVFSAEESHISTSPFKQQTDFQYLTGFPEASAIAVFSNIDKPEFIMFVKPKNEFDELWTGERIGVDNSIAKFNANKAFPLDDFNSEIVGILKNANKVFHKLGDDPLRDDEIIAALKKVRTAKGRTGKGLLPIYDVSEVVGEQRLIKDETEIADLRKAIELSANGFRHAQEILKTGIYEYELVAALTYEYYKGGGVHGFGPIAAGGKNATVLHYPDGKMKINENEMVLIDSGAAYNGYSSDITRTIAINGKKTKEQELVYNAVLRAQLEAIKMIKPGVKVSALHDRAVEVFGEELKSMGIIEKSMSGEDLKKEVKKYFPHNLGHWLGLDTHDAGLYIDNKGESRLLEPGMVLTIEPGLYIRDPKLGKFNGIGVRIEDDILVTKDGHENLSIAIPK